MAAPKERGDGNTPRAVPLWRRDLSDSFRWADAMSAERGWIGDPQPSAEWRDSHYSRQADRINAACLAAEATAGDRNDDGSSSIQ